MRYRFVFVCQGGEIEIKASLLAATLKRFLMSDYELVAAVPSGGLVDQPSHQVLHYLQSLGVQIQAIKNPLEPTYLIGHKLACLALPNDVDKVIFLDSDILCLKDFYHQSRFEQYQLNAKLEDWHHHDVQHWHSLYDGLGLSRPAIIHKSTVFGELMPLYFNAGWIAVDAQSSLHLANSWIEIANLVDTSIDIPRLRPNLDQLTLPLAVMKEELSIDYLTEEFNYPAELRSLDQNALPYFCHYHDPHMILCDAVLTGLVRDLLLDSPQLVSILRHSNNGVWRALLACGTA